MSRPGMPSYDVIHESPQGRLIAAGEVADMLHPDQTRDAGVRAHITFAGGVLLGATEADLSDNFDGILAPHDSLHPDNELGRLVAAGGAVDIMYTEYSNPYEAAVRADATNVGAALIRMVEADATADYDRLQAFYE